MGTGRRPDTGGGGVKYLILHTPRTGSNYLCSLLHQTGIAGIADLEGCGFFMGLHPTINPAAYPAYVQKQTTPNGVFGSKVGAYYFFVEMRKERALAYQIIQDMDKFIWLRRRDKVAQAVSRYIAGKTARWHSNSPKSTQQAADPPYDRFSITAFLADIAADEARAYTLYQEIGKQPLIVWYEDLMRDSRQVVVDCLNFLDIPHGGLPLEFEQIFTKQHNPNKDAYIARYRRGE